MMTVANSARRPRQSDRDAVMPPSRNGTRTTGRTPLVHFEQIEHGKHVRASRHTESFEPRFQPLRKFVIPSALAHIFVPNMDLVRIGLAPLPATPRKNLRVAEPRFHLRDDIGITDVEKFAATLIETFSEICLVVRREFAPLPQADLPEHARKIKQPLLALVWTARKWLRHARMMRPPDNEVHRHEGPARA